MKFITLSIEKRLSLFMGSLLLLAACNNGTGGGARQTTDSAKAATKRIDSLRRASYRNNDLSIIFLDATSRIMQAQVTLEKADNAGNKPAMVDSLIVYSAKGDSLYYALRRMYMAGTAFAESDKQRARFNDFTQPDSSILWLRKHFTGSTPAKALNTLSEFQNDVTEINRIVRD